MPGAAEAYGVLAYPALIVATIVHQFRPAPGARPAGRIEPIIYVIALTALVWLAVTGPFLEDGTIPLDAKAWIWVFPLLDGLLALLVLRRVTLARRPAPSPVPGDGAGLPAVGRRPRRRRLDRLRG